MMGSSNTVFPNLQPRNVDVTLLVLWSIYIAVARGSCWSYSGVNSSKSRRRSTKIAAIACRMWTSSSWCSWWFVLRQCIFHWPCIGWSKGSSNSWHIITPMCIVTTRSLWIACIPSIVVLIWRVHISIVWWHIMNSKNISSKWSHRNTCMLCWICMNWSNVLLRNRGRWCRRGCYGKCNRAPTLLKTTSTQAFRDTKFWLLI